MVYEMVRSSTASCWLTTFHCTLTVVVLQKALAQHAMLVEELNWCALGSVDVQQLQKARANGIGAAVHLRMDTLSCDGEVLCTAVDGAMHGYGFRASYSFNLCKSSTVLPTPGALSTAAARKRRNSSAMALVELAMCHYARVLCACEGVFRLRNCSPGG